MRRPGSGSPVCYSQERSSPVTSGVHSGGLTFSRRWVPTADAQDLRCL